MLSLSDLPDDILNLISIRLNGFDNCSLWMASDSILRQRLVNDVITDFDIKYTTPGRYLWPGNFLKKLLVPQFFSSLPETVTSLWLSISSSSATPEFKYFELLPKNLKVLGTNMKILENLSILPITLRRLNLSSRQGKSSYFDAVPPQLEQLSLGANVPQSLLKHLPGTLKILNLYSDNIFVNDELIAMLPRGLNQLRICSEHNEVTDACDLPMNLESLELLHSMNLTDAFIKKLPRSLTHLFLPHSPKFTDECIKHLPPKLMVLDLSESQAIRCSSFKDVLPFLNR